MPRRPKHFATPTWTPEPPARNPNPRFLQNHHQWLKKWGRDKVQAQIHATVTLMKVCRNMDDFKRTFAKAFGKTQQMELFDFDWLS